MAEVNAKTYPPPDYESDAESFATCRSSTPDVDGEGTTAELLGHEDPERWNCPPPAPLSFRELMAFQRRNVAIEYEQAAGEPLQKQSDKDRSMTIRPGSHLRPLSEPPVMAWSTILREEFSDQKLAALFPHEPGNRARAKDVWGELLALSEYLSWTQGMGKKAMDRSRRGFYVRLADNVMEEFLPVRDEWYTLLSIATELGRFEYKWLDMNGKTTRLERELGKGTLNLEDVGEEVKENISISHRQGTTLPRLACSNTNFSVTMATLRQSKRRSGKGTTSSQGAPTRLKTSTNTSLQPL